MMGYKSFILTMAEMGVSTYNLHGQMTVWPGDNVLYPCSTYELVPPLDGR
jgi:hypothetical protein